MFFLFSLLKANSRDSSRVILGFLSRGKMVSPASFPFALNFKQLDSASGRILRDFFVTAVAKLDILTYNSWAQTAAYYAWG